MTETEKVLHDQIFSLSFKYPVQQIWTAEHFERVVHEYKRFLLLTLVSEQEIIPSSSVLKVKLWDLECTRSLWNQMHLDAGGVAHENINQDVGEHSADKVPHYLNSLDAYHGMFGEPAPDDIWPRPIHRNDVPDEPYTHKMFLPILMLFGMVTFVLVSFGKAIYDSVGNGSYPLVFSVFLGFGFLIWRSARLDHQCPACKKYDALKKTGFLFPADPPKKQFNEYQCTHCLYKLWREYPRYEGGGGGG